MLIPQNKRNIKDKTKIKTMTKAEKIIYKKRIKVENYYAWIKNYAKLTKIYEHSIRSFETILRIISSLITFNKI